MEKNYKNTEQLLIEKYGILLSVPEVAFLLKYKEQTVRNLMASKKWPIPIAKISGSIRMHVQDVARFIDSSIVVRKKRGRPKKCGNDNM
ncbi:MAG: helix-turn-helix domain-containing protein [Bacteroidota bacterium]